MTENICEGKSQEEILCELKWNRDLRKTRGAELKATYYEKLRVIQKPLDESFVRVLKGALELKLTRKSTVSRAIGLSRTAIDNLLKGK